MLIFHLDVTRRRSFLPVQPSSAVIDVAGPTFGDQEDTASPAYDMDCCFAHLIFRWGPEFQYMALQKPDELGNSYRRLSISGQLLADSSALNETLSSCEEERRH